MKIIRQYAKPIPKWSHIFECSWCKSELEIDENDLELCDLNYSGSFSVSCDCCVCRTTRYLTIGKNKSKEYPEINLIKIPDTLIQFFQDQYKKSRKKIK